MKKILIASVAVTGIFITGCSSHAKRVLIFASSDISVNEKTIKVGSGTTHHEQVADFSGSEVSLTVQSPAGNTNLPLTEDGLYILNLKNDTVVGSYQHVATTAIGKITQDELKQKIDSLQQLVVGQNASASKRNYFIPPGKASRISANIDAKVFGPYTTIPSAFDAGSVPEIYKFYTNAEVREIIAKLSASVPPKE